MKFYHRISLKPYLQKIADRCRKEKHGYNGRKYRFDWADNKLYLAALNADGRAMDWILILG